MSVLLLRLAGPMQSWGTQSRFSHRDTGMEPSRSGVIGLLCAAMGRPRDASLDDLAPDKLRMGVRVDHEGRMARDFHSAMDVMKADGSGTGTVISERFYLADASFLVSLEGEQTLLDELNGWLDRPVWQLSLGRKSFVPGEPVRVGVKEGALEEVLRGHEPPSGRLRYVLEVPFGQGEPRQDVPLSFSQRRFGVRHVKVGFWDEEMAACS